MPRLERATRWWARHSLDDSMNDAPALQTEDLAAIHDDVRDRLVRGVHDRRSAFHLMTVASVDERGHPRARTVVLRGVSADLAELAFHTDARSAKSRELAERPACALALYDPRACLQLRIEGTAHLHQQDPVALAAWEKATTHARECYAIEPGPGTVLEAPGAFDWSTEEAVARARFLKVLVGVERIEWLHLRAGGHRRACFLRTDDGFKGHWLVP